MVTLNVVLGNLPAIACNSVVLPDCGGPRIKYIFLGFSTMLISVNTFLASIFFLFFFSPLTICTSL